VELHDGSTLSLDELLVECNVGRHRNEHLGLQDVANAVGIARSTLAGLTTLTREPVTNSANIDAISRFFQLHHPNFATGMLFEFTPPLADISNIAYQAPVDAKDNIRKLGFETEYINAGSMQVYIIDARDDSIITLRGTENHEYDILQDLRFLRSKSEQGSMHGGFVSGYDPMHDQVLKLLERYQTKRVWITGHSLGGGLAVVCAQRLLINEIKRSVILVFNGTPFAILNLAVCASHLETVGNFTSAIYASPTIRNATSARMLLQIVPDDLRLPT